MEQYISKTALIAEIERRKQDAINNCGGFKSMREHECDSCIVWQYEEMEDIINTLEVKEIQEESTNNKLKTESYWENRYKEVLKQFNEKEEKTMKQEEKELLLKDLEWIDMETKECHCYSCELFDSKKNVCKCIDLCKRPKSTYKGFYIK